MLSHSCVNLFSPRGIPAEHRHMQGFGDDPELDFDPLDDTKTWPGQDVEPTLIGTMTLNRNVADHTNENEQLSFGTGVLVDGLDFSDDKMLVGRTFSYSDAQRYRVNPEIHGRLTRKRIPLTNDSLQAGQRYQLLEQWEKDDLLGNFVTLIGQAARAVQERRVWHFYSSTTSSAHGSVGASTSHWTGWRTCRGWRARRCRRTSWPG